MENNTAEFSSFERILNNLPPADSLVIPLLRDFISPPGIVLKERLERRYRRLCFVQGELKSLSEKSGADNSAEAAVSFEDFVFSKMDFSRYGKIPLDEFDFFTESVYDFSPGFFRKNFNMSPPDAESLIRQEYKKIDAFYCLARPNPVILSIMRTMESSLDSVPLIHEEEILLEMNALYSCLNSARNTGQANTADVPQGAISLRALAPFYSFLLQRLDGICVIHKDENQTKLFINPGGGISGTFMPHGKPWTLTLAEPGTAAK